MVGILLPLASQTGSAGPTDLPMTTDSQALFGPASVVFAPAFIFPDTFVNDETAWDDAAENVPG